MLIIVVADGGPGMPETVRQRMEEGGPDEEGRDGLGVDVVVRLLRALEGGIDVVSAPGVGSRITLRVPARIPATPAVDR